MMSVKDLMGNDRYMLPSKKGKDSRPLNERSGIISFFVKELNKEPKVIAIKMSHFSLSDLYALKSGYSDRLNRNGKESAVKYLWWAIKTEEI